MLSLAREQGVNIVIIRIEESHTHTHTHTQRERERERERVVQGRDDGKLKIRQMRKLI